MSGYKYDESLEHIEEIQFNVLSNDLVEDYSCIKDVNGITLPESYDNSEPKRGGLVDTRLGITDSHLVCAYCGLNDKECPGHFGHTKLVSPIFHYGYFQTMKNILNCICLRSSRLLAYSSKNIDELNRIVRTYSGKRRFNEIRKLSSGILYSDVGVPVPKIKEEKKKNSGALYLVTETNLSNIMNEEGEIEEKKTLKDVLTASDVYNILRNISDEDFRTLGFNPDMWRPEDMIITNFPIPPVAIRPSLRADFLASVAYEDDLTHKLADIIKVNEKYRVQKEKELINGEESRYGNDLHNYLQYHILTYFDNDKSAFLPCEQKVGGKKFKSISERIKGKKGRIRQNLMGKRVNFSARSVITSDPYLELNELGIPIKIAMEITFPEVVTSYNIERLTKLVRNGRYIYPGANIVITGNSLGSDNVREYDLRYRKKTMKLKYGDIVERHLYDGDPILFNRQPSLHKLSMMCHRVKIINDRRFSTFRLNVNVVDPYNADFDGDEMNLFAPQSIQTQTELIMIADVNKMIISPRDSTPIIKPKQDSVLGSYKLTLPDAKVDWHDFMNIIVTCIGVDLNSLNIEKNKLYTGRELYNVIIPKNINTTGKTVVQDGDIVKGVINFKASEQIIINCWDKYGPQVTSNYITNIQRIIVNWTLLDGFTVGLKDCYIDNKTKSEINDEVQKKKIEIAHLITEIENNPELNDPEIFEKSILSNLMAQKGDIQNLVMKNINHDNNFFILVDSGAKGKKTNIMQITGVLGQDIFKGRRYDKDINNRTLPHFHQNDDTPTARGYFENSYLEGLSPQEFFFHTMSGREGLIDTAIRTADSGYISRKLMKGLEDIYLTYDGTVRTSNNIITQYIYSDFNLDQTKQKSLKLKTMIMGNNEIEDEFGFTKKEMEEIKKKTKLGLDVIIKLNSTYIKNLLRYRDLMRLTQRVINLNYKTIITDFYSPINFPRLISEEKFNIIENDKDEFCSPEYIIDQIDYLLRPEITQITTFNQSILDNKKSMKMNDEKRSKTLFKYTLYEFLCPKKVIFEYKFTKTKFDNVIQKIIYHFKRAQVEPGEMVGCLAAQHIGEPSTQMSCLWSTNINVCINNKNNKSLNTIYKGEMGKFIDEYMVNNKDKTLSTGHKDSYETILDDNYEYYIVGVNKKEETSFNKISHVSRHPTNGDLMEIKTRSGRKITTTYSHSHLTRTEEDVVPILGKDLKIGLRIPVAKEIKLDLPRIETVKIGDLVIKLNELFGWFIGAYLAEGSINGNSIKITSIKIHFQENTTKIAKIFGKNIIIRKYKGQFGPGVDSSFSHKSLSEFLIEKCNKGSFLKVVPDFAYGAPEEFTKGLLRGYFDGDGNVQCDKLHHGFRACSRSEQLVKDLGLLYAYKGICVNYVTEKDKAGSDLYHYVIPYKYADKYLLEIGSDDEEKLQKINDLIEYSNRDNAHDRAEYIDKIPNLGNIIAKCGKDLKLPGQSRNYGRWKKKESIGRGTLSKYIKIFEEEDKNKIVQREINILKQARDSNVIWDEIVEINNIDDPKEYVYDFTVPGNETFLTGDGIIVHNTLNTFHATGSGSVQMQGVPRVEELTRATKKIRTPVMNIYLNDDIKQDSDKAAKIAATILDTTIKDVVNGYEIIYDNNTNDTGYTKKDKVSSPFYVSMKNDNKNYELMPWLLRIKLNRNKIIENSITLLDIKGNYIKFYKSYLSELKTLKRSDKGLLSVIVGTCILSNFDNSDEPIIHIRFQMTDYSYDMLLNLSDWVLDNFKLKGIQDIEGIDIDPNSRLIEYDKNKKMIESSENVIFTEGINMEDIRYIKGINLNRVYCNEINTIKKYFGIEAARSALLKELTLVYNNYDLNYHHLTILIDSMTHMGIFTSMDRHGINKLDTDPLSRASFEMPIEQLVKAAVFNEVDKMKSVSSRIMAGRVIKGGTGLCDLLLDTDFVMNSEYIDDKDTIERSEFNMIERNDVIADILQRVKFEIFRPN